MKTYFNPSIIENLPQMDPKTRYWLVRGEGGNFYNDFIINNYIAIGWNEITVEEVEKNSYNSDLIRTKLILDNKLRDDTKNRRSMGSAAKQMIKFQSSIRPEHIVMVPSVNSTRFVIGVVKGETYTEKESSKLMVCPYEKRRRVEWIGSFSREQADPLLQKIIYAAHTVSEITQYKSYINRAAFDTYVEGEKMHMTFHVKHEEGIDLDTLTNLLDSYNEINKALYPDQKVKVRLNLQSPGPLEIIGLTAVVGSIAAIIWYRSPIASKIKVGMKEVLKHGGKLSAGKDGVSVELPNRQESENTQKNEERRLTMEEEAHASEMELKNEQIKSQKIENAHKQLELLKEIKEIIPEEAEKPIKKFVENFDYLDGEYPEEFSKALGITTDSQNEKDIAN